MVVSKGQDKREHSTYDHEKQFYFGEALLFPEDDRTVGACRARGAHTLELG